MLSAATPARPAPATAAPQPTPSQPATLDPRFLYSERERRIACRIQARISELSQLLPTLEGEAKTKALIELKQLRLVNIQKKVRREVADEMKKIYAMELAAERQGIKRARLELRPSQRFDRQLQLDTEQRRKQRHREFLNAVQNHARDFKEFHAQNLQRIKKLNRAVMQHHANVEKREAARRERAEKERLRALKMNNEDEYIRLLEQTKNERLKLLLRQTDEYLEKLGTMVQLERIRTEEVLPCAPFYLLLSVLFEMYMQCSLFHRKSVARRPKRRAKRGRRARWRRRTRWRMRRSLASGG
jgi:SWI/SNF-related matrix-associated actin-dependent regulator of chromatin subfamily A protein 2/4